MKLNSDILVRILTERGLILTGKISAAGSGREWPKMGGWALPGCAIVRCGDGQADGRADQALDGDDRDLAKLLR